MYRRSSGAGIPEILLFTISSLVLYYLGVGVALFLVPLQILASRRGPSTLLVACLFFLACFAGLRLAPLLFSRGAAQPGILTLLEVVIVAGLMGGLLVVNLSLTRWKRTLYKISAATALAGVVAAALGWWLSSSASFHQAMQQLYAEISQTLSSILVPAGGASGSAVQSLFSPATLQKLSQAYLVRTVLLDVLVFLSFSWWLGQALSSRALAVLGKPVFRFSAFHLESFWLWPLILCGAVVLLDLFFGLEPWSYAAWNVGLAVLFLYGLQALAIVRFVFEKYRLPRLLWVLLLIGLAVLCASPQAGLYVLLIIPTFGVSEQWVRYRIPREPMPTERQ